MKKTATYNLDVEIIKKLEKIPNRSELINNLLVTHFEQENIKNMSIEELELSIKIDKLNAEHENTISKLKQEMQELSKQRLNENHGV